MRRTLTQLSTGVEKICGGVEMLGYDEKTQQQEKRQVFNVTIICNNILNKKANDVFPSGRYAHKMIVHLQLEKFNGERNGYGAAKTAIKRRRCPFRAVVWFQRKTLIILSAKKHAVPLNVFAYRNIEKKKNASQV